VDAKRIAEFAGSLARCLAIPAFLTRFYEVFADSSPEVAKRFKDTDFEKQKRALSSSLYVMIMALEGGGAALVYLEQIARRHSRGDLDIGPEMYDVWLDCLVQAVKEHDPQASDDTETLWRDAMRPGIEFMRARY